MSNEPFPRLMSDEDVRVIIMALASTRGDRGFDEDELAVALQWAEITRRNYAMLDLVVAGKAALDVIDGDVAFKGLDRDEERKRRRAFAQARKA